jgi:hypothetical protein
MSQSDNSYQVVRLIVISSRRVTKLAGQLGVQSYSDGIGSTATFANPNGVALNSAGTFALVVRMHAINALHLPATGAAHALSALPYPGRLGKSTHPLHQYYIRSCHDACGAKGRVAPNV